MADLHLNSPAPNRLIARNKDDQFQVIPVGRKRAWSDDAYVRLLSVSWWRLIGITTIAYICINLLFASAYFFSGNAIENAREDSFADSFFFSVQTLATIGYGRMAPLGIASNIIVTCEALSGFVFYAMITGLIFSKFSRPTSKLIFSNFAVVNQYQGKKTLMIRLANERANRIVDTSAQVVLLRREMTSEGQIMRRFHDMKLVRKQVPFLQLTWTIMHVIDEESPLYGLSQADLINSETEMIVSLVGLDETLSQTIHARFSYLAEEIIYDSIFEDIIHRREDKKVEIHYHNFHLVKQVDAKIS